MWKYTGDGAWFAGVPARDLTDDEVKDGGWADMLKASTIYEQVSDAEHPRMAARAEKAANPVAEGSE